MTIQKVFYRSAHNYDLDAASDEASVKDFGPSLTVQSQTEDVDINVIMRRFGVTGRMPDNLVVPQYGDFDGIVDFRSALDAVRTAQERFDSMPAEVRARFANSPQRLLEFVSDVSNRPEAVRLGLLKEATPVAVSSVPPSAAPGAASAPPIT